MFCVQVWFLAGGGSVANSSLVIQARQRPQGCLHLLSHPSLSSVISPSFDGLPSGLSISEVGILLSPHCHAAFITSCLVPCLPALLSCFTLCLPGGCMWVNTRTLSPWSSQQSPGKLCSQPDVAVSSGLITLNQRTMENDHFLCASKGKGSGSK